MTKTSLDFHPGVALGIDFDGPYIATDGGPLLLAQLDDRHGLFEAVADGPDPALIEHSLLEQLRQQVFGLMLGYDNQKDATRRIFVRIDQKLCGRTVFGRLAANFTRPPPNRLPQSPSKPLGKLDDLGRSASVGLRCAGPTHKITMSLRISEWFRRLFNSRRILDTQAAADRGVLGGP